MNPNELLTSLFPSLVMCRQFRNPGSQTATFPPKSAETSKGYGLSQQVTRSTWSTVARLIGFNLITDSQKSILKIQRGHKMFQLHWTVDDVWLLSLWFLKLSLFAKHAEDAKVVFHDSNIFKWYLRNHFFPGNGICFVPPSSTPPKYTKIEGLRCKLHKCQGSDICTVCPEMSKNGSNMVKQSGNTLYSKMSRAGDLCTVVNICI